MADTLLTTATVRQLDDLRSPYIKMMPRDYPTATLAQLSKGDPPISKKVQWGEYETFPLNSQVNHAAGYTDADTTIVVDDTTGWQAGMDVIEQSSREIITIGAVDSAVQISGCTRGARGTTAAAIVDRDALIPMSVPRAENYAYSGVVPRMQQPEEIYNLLHLFAEGCAISNTEQALQAHGGKAFGHGYDQSVLDAIENVKASANKQVLWGVRSENGLTRTAGGILQYAGYKDFTTKDITTRKVWEQHFGEFLRNAKGDALVACSFTALEALQYALQGANPNNATGDIVKVAGVEILRIRHFLGGWLYLYHEPSLVDNGDMGSRVGVCMGWIKGKLKQHDNRPVGRYKVPPTSDGLTEQVQLETSWEFRGANNFFVLGGISEPM